MLLWSSSLAFVLFQMTSSQTTSFFKFDTHTFPPSLLPSKCTGFPLDDYFVPAHLHFVIVTLSFPSFLLPPIHVSVHQKIHPSIPWGQKRKSSSTVQYMVSMPRLLLSNLFMLSPHIWSLFPLFSTFTSCNYGRVMPVPECCLTALRY